MTTKTLMLEAPIDLCVDGSGLSRFLAEHDCRILDPAQAVPVDCKRAGAGKGVCDYCAAGQYEKCRYLRPYAPDDEGPQPDRVGVPDAEMVFFKRRGSGSEDCLPVPFGTAKKHVDESLITRIEPLYLATASPAAVEKEQ